MKSFRSYIQEDVAVATKLPDIYLDMDETIVDWISGANAALRRAGHPEWHAEDWNKYSESEADKIRWDVLNSTPNFWENLPFTADGKQIWNFVKKYKPHILSACGSLAGNICRSGKKRWLSKNLGLSNLGNIHLVARSEKKDYARVKGQSCVLIDDYAKNCEEFESSGGIAVQVTTASAVISKLKQLGYT
jgi:phosphoglycolate phosphatase-like HAD superfamily hydrolase